MAGLRHGRPSYRHLSGIPAWRNVLLPVLRHGHPAQRYLRAIPVWRNGLLSGLWHGDLAHRCLSGILPRRSALLSGLRPGDPAHRCLSGILAWRRGHLSTLWHGDPQQNTPVVGARGKTVWNRCQTGLLPMLRPDFGTASPARGLSVASRRGEAVIYRLFVHEKPLFHGH